MTGRASERKKWLKNQKQVEWKTTCKIKTRKTAPKKVNKRAAIRKARASESDLELAASTRGGDRLKKVQQALNTLRKALVDDDPFSPDATYQMAVAFALAYDKGCALDLLKRLGELTDHPEEDVAKRARALASEVKSTDAFDSFSEEAEESVGE